MRHFEAAWQTGHEADFLSYFNDSLIFVEHFALRIRASCQLQGPNSPGVSHGVYYSGRGG